MAPEPTPGVTAKDVEKSDQGKRGHSGLRGHVLVQQIRWEVDRNEHELEPTDAVSGAEKNVAAMRKRFAERFRNRLPVKLLRLRLLVFHQSRRKRQDEEDR